MSRKPMRFWGLPPRPPRTAEEVDLDQRLEAAVKNLAGPQYSRDDWARSQYRASSRSGADKAYFEGHYGAQDMAIMDKHVDQMFWQMVRQELRENLRFVKQMEFIEAFYEMPQHEFLDRIKKRHWAQMQRWTDDRHHRDFLMEIWRAWHAAQLQTEPDWRMEAAERHAQQERAYRSSADALREEYRWARIEDPMINLLDAIEEEYDD